MVRNSVDVGYGQRANEAATFFLSPLVRANVATWRCDPLHCMKYVPFHAAAHPLASNTWKTSGATVHVSNTPRTSMMTCAWRMRA